MAETLSVMKAIGTPEIKCPPPGGTLDDMLHYCGMGGSVIYRGVFHSGGR